MVKNKKQKQKQNKTKNKNKNKNIAKRNSKCLFFAKRLQQSQSTQYWRSEISEKNPREFSLSSYFETGKIILQLYFVLVCLFVYFLFIKTYTSIICWGSQQVIDLDKIPEWILKNLYRVIGISFGPQDLDTTNMSQEN